MISIKQLIHAYAETLEKTWAHDRSKTVGASEIGSCMRRTWFSKRDAPRDPDYQDGWGSKLRGTIMEDAFWVPALRSQLPEGAQLLYAGTEQQTLVKGYLSATTDGIIILASGECINLDCKTFHPNTDLRKEKDAHSFQVQIQMGLIRECTNHKPNVSILSYINASDWSDIREFIIPFNSKVYEHAKLRARMIMTTERAIELLPEGKLSGGKECGWCPWSSHCADITVQGIPHNNTEMLPHEEILRLEVLVNSAREAAATKEETAGQHAQALEAIKQFLREHNIRRFKGDGFSVSYSAMSGRATLDLSAVEAAGIDLSPYYKTGSPSERLVVR
jgi:hypothetical protein